MTKRKNGESVGTAEGAVLGAKPERVALPKKLRFDVLKRDSFTCQYCGAKAPDVLLQVDHVRPVADGGDNNILNLLTSCVGCNGGKGAQLLSDHSALQKKLTQATDLQERREQLEMMAEWQNGLLDLDEDATNHVAEYYCRLVPGRQLTQSGRGRIREMFRSHSLDRVMSQMRASAAKYIYLVNGLATEESAHAFWADVPRALDWEVRCAKEPDLKDLYYIRGIVRNRCPAYFVNHEALAALRSTRSAGVSIQCLRDIALGARSFLGWLDEMKRTRDEAEEGIFR